MLLRRRHSERRHRSSVTMTKDSWLQRSRRLEEEEDEEEEVEVLKVKGVRHLFMLFITCIDT
jgi:hypothetical protein